MDLAEKFLLAVFETFGFPVGVIMNRGAEGARGTILERQQLSDFVPHLVPLDLEQSQKIALHFTFRLFKFNLHFFNF